MSVTERLAGAAERLTELEVPVPDAGRVLRRSRRRRGSVYGVALAAVVLGGIGVVATSRTDQAPVATTVTPTVHAPDAPIGLTRGDAFWPDAQHRPNSAVALGGELAALLGWGDSANIELVCSFLTADTCQPLEGNAPPDGKPTRLRISSPAIGAEVTVDAMAAGTDSGWAFLGIGLEPFEAFPPVRVDGPESASLAYASSPLGTKEVKWWAATHYGELFGAVPAGSPIRIQAPAQSISSVLIVFVDERGTRSGPKAWESQAQRGSPAARSKISPCSSSTAARCSRLHALTTSRRSALLTSSTRWNDSPPPLRCRCQWADTRTLTTQSSPTVSSGSSSNTTSPNFH